MTNLHNSPELWADVPGYEGRYKISSYGKLVAYPHTYVSKGFISPFNIPEKDVRPTLSQKGYLRVNLRGEKRLSISIHRLVALAFIPNPDNKPQINHKDGVKTNNNVSNLEWCNNSENLLHAYRMGLNVAPAGINSRLAKFNNEQIREIRSKNLPVDQLAKKFMVHPSTIHRILRKETYPE